MQMRQRTLTSVISILVVLLLPAQGYHMDGKSKDELKRQVRAVEAAPIQPQQEQGDDRSGELGDGRAERSGQMLSLYPLDSRYLVQHSLAGAYPNARWLSDLARAGRADSNFIRFGRSAGSNFYRAGSKKNNFIRLGRENPRQNNFIRLGRSGSGDSHERFLPKIGFFPDYYYSSSPSAYHWSRFSEPTQSEYEDTTN